MPPSYHEIEDFLNEVGSAKPIRREHHLPREEYGRTDVAFSVTLCARHQGQPFRHQRLADTVVSALKYRRDQGIWLVYAFCLMPDHLHSVVQLRATPGGEPPAKDLLEVLREFKSFTTRAAWRAGLRGKLWQHDQYDSVLRGDHEFETRCHYVQNNPVRKDLVESWTEWPCSGIWDEW
jgi:REP element-mobilizing transposase RayT